MPSHRKRPRVSPEGEDRAAKRPGERRVSKNGSHHEAVSNRPPGPRGNPSTIYIDLTQDELMEGSPLAQIHFETHPLDEPIEVLPESSATAPRDDPNLQAARPVPAYDVCFGLVNLPPTYISYFCLMVTDIANTKSSSFCREFPRPMRRCQTNALV